MITASEGASWPAPALEQFAVFGARLGERRRPTPAEVESSPLTADRPAPWWGLALSGGAHVLLAAGLWALVWATVPALFGWQPTVITGGSMRPSVKVGDILLTRPVGPEHLVPGAVVTFEDPGHPGQLITHRIVEVDPSGGLRVRGDNNQSNDSQLVDPAAVHGRAVVRIPYLGRPLLWLQHGAYLAFLTVILLVTALLWTAIRFPL